MGGVFAKRVANIGFGGGRRVNERKGVGVYVSQPRRESRLVFGLGCNPDAFGNLGGATIIADKLKRLKRLEGAGNKTRRYASPLQNTRINR